MADPKPSAEEQATRMMLKYLTHTSRAVVGFSDLRDAIAALIVQRDRARAERDRAKSSLASEKEARRSDTAWAQNRGQY